MRNFLSYGSAAALALSLTVAAHAQATEPPVAPGDTQDAAAADEVSDDNAIIVTARRTDENLQRVPVAVTVIDEGSLDKGGGFSPLDLGQLAPGIRTTSGVGNRSDIVYSIRGQSVTFGNIFPAVIPYFAEVPIVGEFSTGSFFDVENVQILRGPQGVRFGRVTDGGAVLVQPRRPTNEFGGYVTASAGNYGLLRMEGAINVPVITDRVLLRVAGERNRRNGFTTNLLNGMKLDDVHYDTIRGALVLSPIEGIRNTTFVQKNIAHEANSNQIFVLNEAVYAPGSPRLIALRNALIKAQQVGPRFVENGNPGWGGNYGLYNDRHQTIVSNKTEVDLTDSIQFRNIFGYVETVKRTGFDYDGTAWSRVDSESLRVPRVNQEHISDEPQVVGSSFDKLLNWTVGAYFDKQKPHGPYEQVTGSSTATDNTVLQGSAAVSLQTTTSKAVYGNAELDLSTLGVEGLKVNGGLRYTKDKTNARVRGSVVLPLATFLSNAYDPGQCTNRFPCTTFKAKSDVVTYEVGASYQVNPDMFTYVTLRKGYRPGGINVFITVIDPTGQYAPETTQEFEAGFKLTGHLGTARYRTNVAVYHDKYSNIQKRTNYQDPQTGTFVTSILNAAEATIKGVEFESFLSTEFGFDASLNAAYTDAKYKRGGLTDAQLFNPTNGACNPTVTLNVGFCPLHRFAATPKFQMTASAGYKIPVANGDVRLGVDLYHQSSMAYNDASVLTQSVGPGYTLVNGELTWTNVAGTNLDLTAFVTNLFDKTYIVGEAATPQRASTGTGAKQFGPPRMYGITARYTF